MLLRYGLAEGLPQARAVEIYDAIVGDFESARAGGPREISERYGTAAMEAFCAAGGYRAFSWCEPRDEPFRRKAFVEGWVDTVGQDPSFALPSGDKPKALPEGDPPKAEASVLLSRIVKGAETPSQPNAAPRQGVQERE